MDFYKEQYKKERSQIQRRLRQTRIRGCILGAGTFFLAGILALMAIQKNQDREIWARAKNRLEIVGRSSLDQDFSDEEGLGQDILMLVNKEHPLPSDYEVELYWLENSSCAVAKEMYDSLQAMLAEGSREGLDFVVASGYRSREYQQQLLDEDVQAAMEREGLTWQQAYEKETRETMPPGCSEHETGLAVDIVSREYQVLDKQQETTRENQWLRENCSRFGFILRYPEGKEEITGIDYESWHFRYVGEKAAKEISRKGITLEEYI